MSTPPTSTPSNPRNRLGLDYRAEASRFRDLGHPIVDVHTHVNGVRASHLFRDVMDVFSVGMTFSQTLIDEAPAVRNALGDRVRFIAVPRFHAEDKAHAFTQGFLDDLDVWHGEFGARCMKIWNAPRIIDFVEHFADDPLFHPSEVIPLDSPWRRRVADKAVELGMMFMTHVADPDTWFAAKYSDAERYGSKASHYEPLERMLELYPVPWIAAHMGGWPENLTFLDGLLERHPNLLLDTSATKWMVRELSKHTDDELVSFLAKHRGRILFGSDIVTRDEHLAPAADPAQFSADLASSEAEAHELYASRYWALRTMWETDYAGPSSISDPDLHMTDPDTHTKLDAPRLTGRSLRADLLRSLYYDAPTQTIRRWYDTHP